MASNVDPTFPQDDEQVDKGDFRAQMTIINAEITALQQKVTLAWQMAMGVVSL